VLESSLLSFCLVEIISETPLPTKLKAIKKEQIVRIDFLP